MKKIIIDVLAGTMAIVGLVVSGALMVNAASADPGPQVCSQPHRFDATGPSHTYTAPDGMLVSGYCVKAGSVQQGNGPEYTVVDPPAKTVTIAHSSGKDISHYSVTLVPEETEPTDTPITDTPTEQPTDPTSTPPVVTETPVVPTTEPTWVPTVIDDIGWPEVEINCSAHKCTKTTKNSETGEVIDHEEIVYPVTAEEEGL